jgi:HD superfamily phosphodiesterase
MKFKPVVLLAQQAFQYVMQTCNKYQIDESHALKHSMEVFHMTNKIYQKEVMKFPYLQQQKEVIFLSAILHDMCDKKYMPEDTGIVQIQKYLKKNEMLEQTEITMLGKIISTMSYSKVKEYGFPELGEYQLAYHIVREADLLAAYDIDRCMIYSMYKEGLDYEGALKRTIGVFDERVLKYRSDRLFVTAYSQNLSLKLHDRAVSELEVLRKLL